MASCHKCGKLKIRKNTNGHRYCSRCGCVSNPMGGVDRAGNEITVKLSDLDDLPDTTRLATVRTFIRLKHMNDKLEKELAQ